MIKSESRGDVAVLTIDRHEKRNALSAQLTRSLLDALTSAAEDSRAIVITGAGSSFCSGADLDEDKQSGDFFPALTELLSTVRRVHVPVIAYVNGPAIGAGMMLAMVCDIRVAAEASVFGLPVGDQAIGVEGSIVQLLSELVGGSRARLMLLAGARLTFAEAVSCGMCVPRSFDDALALASDCAAKAPLTLRNVKAEFAPDLFDAKERDRLRLAALRSEDMREAMQARAEKRAPRFTGR
ncbi:enoyl-CoA hydratase-related protein [Corynebacterium sanguinis]|uniref:enoyl-CoA hydratase-related protein n=1 Tax=Corynebacterium sanguinis TaxID=2594913 RepID=UPI0021AF3E40|nr:enoyl-CoA hydratase-related protein [Corynebacterium sanguinis]MCT1596866.1 enoyl-CoA hydratase-related protein [Corynebacterium sanguinis]